MSGKRVNDSGTTAETRLALAEVAVEANRFAEAEEYSQTASAEFEKERQVDQQAMSEAALAKALLGRQDMGAADIALRLAASFEDKDSQLNAGLGVWKVLDACGRKRRRCEKSSRWSQKLSGVSAYLNV